MTVGAVLALIIVRAHDSAGGALDGTWQELAPPERASASAVYDQANDRLLLFGGSAAGVQFNDIWALGLAGTPSWVPLVTTGVSPATNPNFVSTMFVDAAHARVVVFTPSVAVVSLLDLPTGTWSSIAIAGSQPVEAFSSPPIFDPIRNRLLIFGGAVYGPRGQINVSNNLWSLDLSDGASWTLLTPGGSLPPARYQHAEIYDPVRDRLVVFGGTSATGALLDSWALTLGGAPTWSALSPVGSVPTEPAGFPAFYDPTDDAMIVFGRTSLIGQLSLSGQGQWASVSASGAQPPNGSGFVLALDSDRNRLLLTGGSTDGGETWALDLGGTGSWTRLIAPAPGRSSASAIVDPEGDQLLLFGGSTTSANGAVTDMNDSWARGLGDVQAWGPLPTQGAPPLPRSSHTAVLDRQRHRMVVFGGSGSALPYFNDVWTLSLGDSPAWLQLQPHGSLPDGRWNHTAIYDTRDQEMVVFGGAVLGPPTPGAPSGGAVQVGDTWILSLAGDPAWTPFVPSGSAPPPRYAHSSIYDSRRNRMIVFGGFAADTFRGDTWALSLGNSPQWTQLLPTGGPGPHAGHIAIYDSLADRMVIFGGVGPTGPLSNSAWALSFAVDPPAWSQLAPSGTPPVSRLWEAAAFDEARRSMIVIGGGVAGQIISASDSWALEWPTDIATPVLVSLVDADATAADVHLVWYSSGGAGGLATVERATTQGQWTAIGTIEPDGTGKLVFDDRSVVAGGRYGYRLSLPSTSTAEATTEVWVNVPNTAELSLHGGSPNPSTAHPRIAFSLASGAPALLELFDIGGGRRLARDVGSLGPGEHVLALPDIALSPGVYFVHLRQAGQTRIARMVSIR